MTACQVPDCLHEAEHRGWAHEDPLVTYGQGLALRLSVEDLAVTLALCERHGDELVGEAMQAASAKLASWNWKPLGSGDGQQ